MELLLHSLHCAIRRLHYHKCRQIVGSFGTDRIRGIMLLPAPIVVRPVRVEVLCLSHTQLSPQQQECQFRRRERARHLLLLRSVHASSLISRLFGSVRACCRCGGSSRAEAILPPSLLACGYAGECGELLGRFVVRESSVASNGEACERGVRRSATRATCC